MISMSAKVVPYLQRARPKSGIVFRAPAADVKAHDFIYLGDLKYIRRPFLLLWLFGDILSQGPAAPFPSPWRWDVMGTPTPAGGGHAVGFHFVGVKEESQAWKLLDAVCSQRNIMVYSTNICCLLNSGPGSSCPSMGARQ